MPIGYEKAVRSKVIRAAPAPSARMVAVAAVPVAPHPIAILYFTNAEPATLYLLLDSTNLINWQTNQWTITMINQQTGYLSWTDYATIKPDAKFYRIRSP